MGDETFVLRNFNYGTRVVPLSYLGLIPELLRGFAQVVDGINAGTLTIGGIDMAS
jgi:hypothetical protein